MKKHFDSSRDGLSIPLTSSHHESDGPIAERFGNYDAVPWVEVDLAAIRANYRTFKSVAPTAKIIPVIKCDGYGLGAAEIARSLIQHEDCNSFYVAHAEEGRVLRLALNATLSTEQSNIIEIYVLHGPSPSTLSLFRDYRLTPVLNTQAQATLWASSFANEPAILHIDTGMNRLGLSAERILAVKDIDTLNIVTVMSHLSCAGDQNSHMNARQRAQFLAAAIHFPGARLSLSASGGALLNDSYHYSEIRLGISLYGCTITDEPDKRLMPVAKLLAPIIQIRDVPKGETVGYDATWKASRNSRIATASIGYGDGYPRCLSERGNALVQGVRCPVVGRISMDMITVDVTDASQGLAVGDSVELFGPKLAISEVAKLAETTSYEILTGLGHRIERVHITNQG